MKKIFLDTNVILDYYLDQEGFSDEAERIFTYGCGNILSLFISSLSFSNVAYIARKKFPGDAIIRF